MKLLVVAAATSLMIAPSPPFPPPKLIGVTPDTKCDWGPINENKSSVLVVQTDAGPFEVQIGSNARFAGLDGKPLASRGDLRTGQKVRVYYLVDNRVGGGAKAQEIDLIP